MLTAMLVLLTAVACVRPRAHEGHTVSGWISMLRSPRAAERVRAVDALFALDQRPPGTPRGVPAVTMALEDADADVRLTAAVALALWGARARAAVPALAARLRSDASDAVRLAAANALGRVGVGSAEAVAALRDGLDDPAPDVRAAAADALDRLDRAARRAFSTQHARFDDSVPRGATARRG